MWLSFILPLSPVCLSVLLSSCPVVHFAPQTNPHFLHFNIFAVFLYLFSPSFLFPRLTPCWLRRRLVATSSFDYLHVCFFNSNTSNLSTFYFFFCSCFHFFFHPIWSTSLSIIRMTSSSSWVNGRLPLTKRSASSSILHRRRRQRFQFSNQNQNQKKLWNQKSLFSGALLKRLSKRLRWVGIFWRRFSGLFGFFSVSYFSLIFRFSST